ncbi:hypothetical protein [Nocardioides mesophilus]|uniref:Uncharacterized protein n=1 Tax=Nocardioides mesophilus TaxID=433659 RepID=A0A7G9RFH6_9ACTN|nr:hypothetical protein [Nocardioides mesophilus]QNN54351.1 hypothetical protein H9L09_08485 [Nocardioides mesophilus]
MSTAPSSTEPHGPAPLSPPGTGLRLSRRERVQWAIADVGALLRFRSNGVRGRSRTAVMLALVLILTVTVLVSWLPGYLPDGDGRHQDVLLLLPTGYIGLLVISIVSAAASGGGRELLPREQAVAYPVSPTTDHLGALLMAPLNIAWLLQAWTLLGATSYVVGPTWKLLLAQVPVLLWLFAATALAQVVAWGIEWLRRGTHGLLTVRLLVIALGASLAALISSDNLVPLLDRSPTLRITFGVLYGADGQVWNWLKVVLALVALALAAVVVGAWVATAVVRRPARDELREEASSRPPRPHAGSDLAALLRTDRVGIWRSVPLRRGLAVLALLPGLVALAGGLDWSMLSILPGLVASGGALLFGVNSWCLDGRGALWRDSLPVSPRLVFWSRATVLVEVLLVATVLTVVLGSLRAGPPTSAQLAGVLCCGLVVTVQVVATSLRWSVKRPFAVDLRSARATPAPPVVMVGYSARLALTTTLTGMVFGAATYASWPWSVLLALPFLLFSAAKLVGTANEWADPTTRSMVVATVAS